MKVILWKFLEILKKFLHNCLHKKLLNSHLTPPADESERKFCNSWNENKRNKLLLITHLHPFFHHLDTSKVKEVGMWMLNNLIVERVSWKFATTFAREIERPRVRQLITNLLLISEFKASACAVEWKTRLCVYSLLKSSTWYFQHENVVISAWNIWKMLLINLIKDHITKYQENNKSYDAPLRCVS